MPTGYTYAIEKGCTFEEFVWSCARAFGACVTMRDEPASTPVPDEFRPEAYHLEEIEKASHELSRLERMSPAEIEAEIGREIERVIQANEEYVRENKAKKAKYEAMLEKVREWRYPTEEHRELKKFMLEQIRISLPEKPYQQPMPTRDPAVWLAEKKSQLTSNLAYHHREHAKDLERVSGRNAWIRALRESVPQPRAAA